MLLGWWYIGVVQYGKGGGQKSVGGAITLRVMVKGTGMGGGQKSAGGAATLLVKVSIPDTYGLPSEA